MAEVVQLSYSVDPELGLSDQDELVSIIEQQRIDTLFQPIIDLQNQQVFAYEALSRGPADSPLFMPELMFEAARRYQMVSDLDHVCRRKAVEKFKAQNLPGKLSLNICPSSLVEPDFKGGRTLRLLEQAGLGSDRIIMELTEHKQEDISELKAAARHYKDMGFSLALDDLGAGYSNLRLLAELRPDFLKLDKYFVSGVNHNSVEADFVKLIVELANRVNCRVVAEGIETLDDLRFVQNSGIQFGQGYLLGRPLAKAETNSPNILNDTACLAEGTSDKEGFTLGNRDRVGSLSLLPTEPCSSQDMITTVLHRFQSYPQLLAVPVVDNGRVVGAVTRDEVLKAFSTPFAHSLYHKSLVADLMLSSPLVVQMCESLAKASQDATSRSFNLVYSPLIVCEGQAYVGMVSIRELLEKITQTQVEHALNCNPLSGLPGNKRIASEVQARLDEGREFALAYFDLDNFKAFNDKYAFERGNQLILLVAEVLSAHALEDDFVGHIGGDDFVMVMSDMDWESRIWGALDDFKARSPLLYDVAAQKDGYIESVDRLGEPKRFALTSLSVSAVVCAPGKFTSHLQATEVLGEIKTQSKSILGNSLVVDRREKVGL